MFLVTIIYTTVLQIMNSLLNKIEFIETTKLHTHRVAELRDLGRQPQFAVSYEGPLL
jgi:hypothetical protein